MTPDELRVLADRAVACRGWRWMPGMRVVGIPSRMLLEDEDGCGRWIDSTPTDCLMAQGIPDLTDPATLGCLLALVREAWRCPAVYARQGTTRRVSDGVLAWEVCGLWLDAEACRALGVDRQGSVGSWGHASEAEALVAALEAAP